MKRKWITKDGKKLWIKDMSDNHLLNSMKLCQRYAFATDLQKGIDLLKYLSQPPISDAVEDSLESSMMEPWYHCLPSVYFSLLHYARKRKFWNKKLETQFNPEEDDPYFPCFKPYWI